MKFKDGDPQTQRQHTSWSWSRRKESCAEWGSLPFSLSLTLSLFHSLYLSLFRSCSPWGLCKGRSSRQLMNM